MNVLPVDLIRSGMELGYVIRPSLIDRVVDVYLPMSKSGFHPFISDEVFKQVYTGVSREFEDHVVVETVSNRSLQYGEYLKFYPVPRKSITEGLFVQDVHEVS